MSRTSVKLFSNKSIPFALSNRIEFDNATDLYIGNYIIKESKYNVINNNLNECGTIAGDYLKPQEYIIINDVNNGSDLWDYKIISNKERRSITEIEYLVNLETLYTKLSLNMLRQIDLDMISYGVYKKVKRFDPLNIRDSWKAPNIKHINNDNKQPYMGDVKLYSYQLRTLQWLKHVESTVYNQGITYTSVIPMNQVLEVDNFEEYYFDYVNQQIVHTNDIVKKLTLKGGILADEMGLGKTITMISLLIDKQRHDLKIDLKNLNKINVELSENEKIKTKANLVVCPSHLAKQWYSEAVRCNPKMKIVLITTKPQHDGIAYKDLLEADLVIVTFQFLTNITHYPSLSYKKMTPTQLTSNFTERIQSLNTNLKSLLGPNTNASMGLTQPILEHFEWYRIIVDEAHELFGMSQWNANHTDKFLNMLLQSMESVYKWYVSGTPFTSEDGFRSVTQFLGLKSHNKYTIMLKDKSQEVIKCLDFKQLIDRGMNEQSLYDDIMRQLYCRNTKASIGDEWNIPSIIEETVMLNLTNIERGMYEQGKNNGDLYLRQICCHPNISDQDVEALGGEELSLEDVRLKLIEYKKTLIEENNSKVAALDRNKDNEHNYEYRRKQLVSKNKELEYEIRFFSNLDPVVPKLPEDSCPICMGDFEDVVVTDCGHYYCKECIMNALNVSKKMCPMCRQPLTMKNIYSMKKSDSPQVDYVTFQYGSKMGRLITMCKQIFNDPNARIIIFSQWERLLLAIGRTLKENKINNVYCRGNVHQRNSTIKAFKDGIRDGKETKVIMLSLEHSASGTNLTEATHIIMMDPVDGTKEEIKAIEGQAIGRAARMGQTKQVKVIRMITKGTIEEDIYKKSL
jgi:DNA repair protein RAD5